MKYINIKDSILDKIKELNSTDINDNKIKELSINYSSYRGDVNIELDKNYSKSDLSAFLKDIDIRCSEDSFINKVEGIIWINSGQERIEKEIGDNEWKLYCNKSLK